MWQVIKINKKKLFLFKNDLTNKFGKDFIIYSPKLLLMKKKNNKIINREIPILGDYIFCFHKSFKNNSFTNFLNNLRGLKEILKGCKESQLELVNFINQCKKAENDKGFLTQKFYELNTEKNYKFLNGPFSEKIFRIVDLQKNKIKVLIGNLNVQLSRKKLLCNTI